RARLPPPRRPYWRRVPSARERRKASAAPSPGIRGYSLRRRRFETETVGQNTNSVSISVSVLFGSRDALHRGDELFHVRERHVEELFLARGDIYFDYFLDPARTDHPRHAEVVAVDAVFAFEICGARKDFFFVLKVRFRHAHRGGRRGIKGRAGLQERHNLAARVA